MKQLFAVALAVAVAAPACAQHGGGGHGGVGGGFHSGGVVSHGGFAAPGGFAPPMSTGAPRYAPRYGGQGGYRYGGSGTRYGRPAYYHGGWRRYGYAVPYGYGVGVVGYGGPGYGWVDANGPGYAAGYDSGYDVANGDGGAYDGGPYGDEPGAGGEGYVAQAQGGEEPPVPYVAEGPEGGSGYGKSGEQAAAPISRGSPAGGRSSVAKPAAAQASLDDDEGVKLIFKDGRAPETIHNYALTRKTLYVTDARPREIPVAALDLAATEKVNRAAGVRFQLPVTQ